MRWLCSGYPLAMRWLFCPELDVDKSGQIGTTEDRNGQNWTEVDNVLFWRFTFDPSKAQTLTVPTNRSTDASEGGTDEG
jgi:hypothetical protein